MLGELSFVSDEQVVEQPAMSVEAPVEAPVQGVATVAISPNVLEELAQAASAVVTAVEEKALEIATEPDSRADLAPSDATPSDPPASSAVVAAEPEVVNTDWATISEVLARAVASMPVEKREDIVPAAEKVEASVAEAVVALATVEAPAPVVEQVAASAEAPIEAPVVEAAPAAAVRDFNSLEDWAAISPMLQANLMVLPVAVSHGATLIPMPEPAVQWPVVIVGGMLSPMLAGWDGTNEGHGSGKIEAPAAPAAEESCAVEPAPVTVEEPAIGEIEVIWTSAPAISASMTVDVVWDEPQAEAPKAASVAPTHSGPNFHYPAPHVAGHVPAHAETHAAPIDSTALLPVESVVAEVAPADERPVAPEPQTVGWMGQGNPEGWGPLAAAVTVAPVIGTAPPASSLTGMQSFSRRPLLPQGDARPRRRPKSNHPYAFEAPLDLTPLWAVLGVLGVAGFAALLWFVVIPIMLPKGHPAPGGPLPALQSGETPKGTNTGKPTDRKDAKDVSAAAVQPRPRPATPNQGHPASRPAAWLA